MSPSSPADDPSSKDNPPSPPPAQSSHTSVQQSIPKVPQFPPHNAPRVWFITDGLTPVAISLSRYLLDHGDYVVAGVVPTEFTEKRGDELREFLAEVAHEGEGEERRSEENGEPRTMKRWRERFKVVGLDARFALNIQAKRSSISLTSISESLANASPPSPKPSKPFTASTSC